MFKLNVSQTVTVPVTGTISDANGAPQQFKFSLVMARSTAADLRSMEERAKEVNAEATLVDMLVPLVKGWVAVADEEGAPLDFNEANLRSLLEIVSMAALVSRCYVDACGVKGKEKN